MLFVRNVHLHLVWKEPVIAHGAKSGIQSAVTVKVRKAESLWRHYSWRVMHYNSSSLANAGTVHHYEIGWYDSTKAATAAGARIPKSKRYLRFKVCA